MTTTPRYFVCSLFLLVFVAAAPANAKTWNIGTWGNDVQGCGTTAGPCRSLSYAIQRAAANDTILVGPGDYGDIDGDAQLATPGDEKSPLSFNNRKSLVLISKPLKIYSTQGAQQTRIDASPRWSGELSLHDYVVVLITSGNVEFGRVGQGFTVIGADGIGIDTDVSGSGVKIAGNIATGHSSAFHIDAGGTAPEIHHNMAFRNSGTGFLINSIGANIHHNIAQGGGTGFEITGSSTSRIFENIATGNLQGFIVEKTAFMDRNSVVGNLFEGLWFRGAGPFTIRNSNIYGNQANAWPHDCEVRNDSSVPINARYNFWGQLDGLRVEPGDQLCDGFGAAWRSFSVPFQTAPLTIPAAKQSPF